MTVASGIEVRTCTAASPNPWIPWQPGCRVVWQHPDAVVAVVSKRSADDGHVYMKCPHCRGMWMK